MAFAGGHPAAWRTDRDRVAGAAIRVAQGLRRRVARRGDRRAAAWHACGDGRGRVARGADLPCAQRDRDPAGAGHGGYDPRRPGARPDGSGAGMTLVRAAVVPSTPLLARELTGRSVVLPELREACAVAVGRLLGAPVD